MEPFEIEKYKQIALRRRWWIIIPFLLSILTGIVLILVLPKVYQSNTLILIQPQKVPASYVQEIVSVDIEDRVRTITQQVTSRTNLEKIIKEFDLYNEPGSYMFMEDKVKILRENISIEVSGGSGRRSGGTPTSFQIFFTGKYPKRVANVTNALASYFIAQNLKIREDQAIGTSEFLTDELENIRRRLLEKEEELKRYRERYMGGLPEQLETNLRILERIQGQIVTNQENLREAENRKLMIQQQIAEAAQIRISSTIIPVTPGREAEQPMSLDQLKIQLASLEARYTERHPDVISLKEKIADLESKEKTDVKEAQKLPKNRDMIQAERNLVNQLREIELGIKNLKAEAAQLHSQMKSYQTQVENTPKREQELMSLNRDYNNIRETYNSLLGRKLEAELAVSMERKQKGEQFRILDPAEVPIRPLKPDIRRILLMTVLLGFALGCGLAYLRETMDTSFRRPEDVEEVLQVPIIASLPFTLSARELKRIKRKEILTVVSVGLTFLLLGVVIVLSLKGVDATINFVKEILARL
ncbi:MAG TPA: XrtA system polysaccharide chain length determinant [Desulfatiglandales bacterium]|nr:XrtA system polysaccharide chain length determinant [Desulfatiglandales bacterium]